MRELIFSHFDLSDFFTIVRYFSRALLIIIVIFCFR